MNKKLLFGLGGAHLLLVVIGIIVLGGAAFFAKHNPSSSKTAGTYCSPDGTLSDTMPIQSHRSYCVKSDAGGKTFTSNTPSPYSFSIVDDEGNIVDDFTITHTKQMHVIVVRKDLANFQHVHPKFNESTGVFTLKDLTFPMEGEYRIFADFAPESAMKDPMGMPLVVTLSEDVKVGSNYVTQPSGSEEKIKTFDGIQTTLSTTPANLVSGSEAMLSFTLKQNGKAVTDLQKYLGALGHSVILREGTLDFIHAHPMEKTAQDGKVEFMVTFPQAGKYKVFTQFQKGEKVTTTDFVVSVNQGSNTPMMPDMDMMDMPGMDHPMN